MTNSGSSYRTCPDCGATIYRDDAPCWLCAYQVTEDRHPRPVAHPPEQYESFYQSTYFLIIGFLVLIGLGQFYDVVTHRYLGGGIGLIGYGVFALGVVLSTMTTRHGTSYRRRTFRLLTSIVVSALVAFLIVVAMLIALFVACMVAFGNAH